MGMSRRKMFLEQSAGGFHLCWVTELPCASAPGTSSFSTLCSAPEGAKLCLIETVQTDSAQTTGVEPTCC